MMRFVNKEQQYEELVKLKSMQRALILDDLAVNRETSGVSKENAHEITISLTTFSYRINDVYLTIESLFQQSIKATRIILWLSTKNFPNGEADIPAILKKQMQRGLEVVFCEEDIGPYKKFFYALKKYPQSLVLTVDDDVLYASDTVDLLYRSYLQSPNIIHCLRAHKMLYDRAGRLLPYKKWPKGIQQREAGLDIFPTGVGGVLYFPGCFDDEILNKEAFLALAPNSDDVWLKAMSLKKGTYCQKVNDEREWGPRNMTIEGSQKYALKRKNKSTDDGNDPKISAVFNKYDLWNKLI